MAVQSLSINEVRRLILNAQLLDQAFTCDRDAGETLAIIDHLGYVQIDTISVIQRTHHHVLHTRQPLYINENLHQLLAEERSIFEYWGHAMSYLPISDYRFYKPRMKQFLNPKTKWGKMQLEQAGHLLNPILERIRKEGPLSAKDFKSEPKKSNGWWDWKPSKVALEFLFWRGDLMVRERDKFQKIYDLTERVLPAGLDTEEPTEKELARFIIKRALQAMAVATENDIQKFLQPAAGRDSDLRVVASETISTEIQEAVHKGEIEKVKIEGLNESDWYINSKTLNKPIPAPSAKKQLHILSPFDNLIIQRERLKQLFDFDYSLECYTPEAKRKFGYFVLPILWNGDFVGRLDAKAERKSKTLIIQSFYLEKELDDFNEFEIVFRYKLSEMAKFNQCESVEFKNIEPKKYKTVFRKYTI